MSSKRYFSQKWLGIVLCVLVVSLAMTSPAEAARKKGHPVRVKAAKTWVDTKLQVSAGDKVSLKAVGIAITSPLRQFPKAKGGPGGQAWNPTCGDAAGAPPPCALDHAPYGALVGRIGSGAPFLIGSAKSFTAGGSGTLWLAVNDNLNAYKDNKGGFAIVFK